MRTVEETGAVDVEIETDGGGDGDQMSWHWRHQCIPIVEVHCQSPHRELCICLQMSRNVDSRGNGSERCRDQDEWRW